MLAMAFNQSSYRRIIIIKNVCSNICTIIYTSRNLWQLIFSQPCSWVQVFSSGTLASRMTTRNYLAIYLLATARAQVFLSEYFCVLRKLQYGENVRRMLNDLLWNRLFNAYSSSYTSRRQGVKPVEYFEKLERFNLIPFG